MPECEMDYLVQAFREVGPAVSNGMGLSPVSFAEIESWSRTTGNPLTGWQASALRRMSDEYVSCSARASDHLMPPPWQPVAIHDAAAVSAKARDVFRRAGAAAAKKKRGR